MTLVSGNRRSLFIGTLLGATYASLTLIDLLTTQQLLQRPNTREFNPLVNTTDFSANYLPALLVSLVIFSGLLWGLYDQSERYKRTGKFIKITMNNVPGARKLDISYAVLLVGMIALFSRFVTVLQVTSALHFEVNLFPPLFIFNWPYSISSLDQKAADLLFLVNRSLIWTFAIYLPLSIFSMRRLILLSCKSGDQ